jgi:hypothetical protein
VTAINQVLTLFRDMSDEERRDCFAALTTDWCAECGCFKPGGRTCPCWNDE